MILTLELRDKLQRCLERHTTRGKTGCVLWTASTAGGGYGMASAQHAGVRVQMPAHRAAWLLSGRELSEGVFVCHKCDNRRCVAVDHLFLGTQKANMIDCARKERVKNAKLIRTQAAHIFTSRAPRAYLAAHYGVSIEVVRNIRKRRAYAWATEGLVRGSSF